jgi:hypothetical protein
MRLGMSHRQSHGVGMPRAGVPPLPSKVPPMARTACAYLSWFVFIIELNYLPRKPRGEPCTHDTVGGPFDTQLIL